MRPHLYWLPLLQPMAASGCLALSISRAAPPYRRAGVFYAAPHASPSASVAAAPPPISAVGRTKRTNPVALEDPPSSFRPPAWAESVGVTSLPPTPSQAREPDFRRRKGRKRRPSFARKWGGGSRGVSILARVLGSSRDR
jgi:hypothetical protein